MDDSSSIRHRTIINKTFPFSRDSSNLERNRKEKPKVEANVTFHSLVQRAKYKKRIFNSFDVDKRNFWFPCRRMILLPFDGETIINRTFPFSRDSSEERSRKGKREVETAVGMLIAGRDNVLRPVSVRRHRKSPVLESLQDNGGRKHVI